MSKMNNVGIIDVGLGNIGSVIRMIEKAGGQCVRIGTPEDLPRHAKVILPGVGHFDHGSALLQKAGFFSALRDFAAADGNTLMGICLGMQMLFDGSEEGAEPGLSLIPGGVVKIRPQDVRLPVPHMGWNEIILVRDNLLLRQQEDDGRRSRFYFVHSYQAHCEDENDVLGVVHYSGPVTAGVQRGNVWGMQFHPEKSHRFGLALMQRFVGL